MFVNYSAGFPSVSNTKCALCEPCADPARGRCGRCHNKLFFNFKNKMLFFVVIFYFILLTIT